jgi:Fe-S cluster assembly iron-binding protein IscA
MEVKVTQSAAEYINYMIAKKGGNLAARVYVSNIG